MRPSLLALSLTLAAAGAHADEGMWLPSQLPQIATQLRDAGFEGDPASLADLHHGVERRAGEVGQ